MPDMTPSTVSEDQQILDAIQADSKRSVSDYSKWYLLSNGWITLFKTSVDNETALMPSFSNADIINTYHDKLGPVLKSGMEEGVSYVMVTYKTWRQVVDAYPPTLNVDRQNAALDRPPVGDHEIIRLVEYFGRDGRTEPRVITYPLFLRVLIIGERADMPTAQVECAPVRVLNGSTQGSDLDTSATGSAGVDVSLNVSSDEPMNVSTEEDPLFADRFEQYNNNGAPFEMIEDAAVPDNYAELIQNFTPKRSDHLGEFLSNILRKMQFEPSFTPADLHVYIQHNCDDGNSDYLEAILQSEPGCPEETLDSLCGTFVLDVQSQSQSDNVVRTHIQDYCTQTGVLLQKPQGPLQMFGNSSAIPLPAPSIVGRFSPPMADYASGSGRYPQEKTTPGLCGLSNIGNTCFMNSALQCLSNVPALTDYLLMTHEDKEGVTVYNTERDLNKENPLGTGGVLANAYANLIRAMWSGNETSTIPRHFKMAVAQLNSEFGGYRQQDSQELMITALDGLHEDLNRVKVKPYIQERDYDGRPDDVIAAEAWANFKRRNDSIVVDLFYGQLKSRLHCPECGTVSVKFDPFNFLPLALPTRAMYRQVTGLFADVDPNTDATVWKKIDIQIAFDSSDSSSYSQYPQSYDKSAVLAAVVEACNAPASELSAFVVDMYSQTKLAALDAQTMYNTVSNYSLNTSTAPPIRVFRKRRSPSPVDDEAPKAETWCDVAVVVQHAKPGQSPTNLTASVSCHQHLFVRVRESELNYEDVYAECVKQLSAGFANFEQGEDDDAEWWAEEEPETVDEPSISAVEVDENGNAAEVPMAVSNSSNNDSGVEDNDDSASSVREADSSSPPPYFELFVGGKPSMGEYCSLTNISEFAPYTADDTDSKVTLMRASLHVQRKLNTSSSSDDKTESESSPLPPARPVWKLQMALVWHPNAYKRFVVDKPYDNMENLPNVASVLREKNADGVITVDDCMKLFTSHEQLSDKNPWFCPKCKDFRRATKQMDVWKLPKTLIVQLKRFRQEEHSSMRRKNASFVDCPLRGLDLSNYVHSPHHPPAVYDLLSVSNHAGTIGFGHYTAYGLNKETNKWYDFNDSHVSEVDPDITKIVSSEAYVLLYERRDTQRTIIRRPWKRRMKNKGRTV